MPAERTVVAMNDDCCRNETLDTFCGSDAVASTVWLRIGYRFRRCLVRVHTDRISEGVLMFILRGNHMQLACKLTVASVSSLFYLKRHALLYRHRSWKTLSGIHITNKSIGYVINCWCVQQTSDHVSILAFCTSSIYLTTFFERTSTI